MPNRMDALLTTGPAKNVSEASGVGATSPAWNRVIALSRTVSFGFNGAIEGAAAQTVPEGTFNGALLVRMGTWILIGPRIQRIGG